MIGSRIKLHIFKGGSIIKACYPNEILLPHMRLFRGVMGAQFLFMNENTLCHRKVAIEKMMVSEDIERMYISAKSTYVNLIEHMWDFPGGYLAVRVTYRQ